MDKHKDAHMTTQDYFDTYKPEREQLAYFMRRVYEKGLSTCSGGNLSVRTPSGHILITPSALDKGRIEAGQICMLSPRGENLTLALKTSIETEMHRGAYAARPDIAAIVHAHPVTATSFTAMNAKIDTTLTAEAYAVLGRLAWARYALMGTGALAQIVAESLKDANIVLMENHGVMAVGSTLLEAFDRLEVLEAAAKMTLFTRIMGGSTPIQGERLEELDRFKMGS
jgi:L-fuculose-phosphate aldolase